MEQGRPVTASHEVAGHEQASKRRGEKSDYYDIAAVVDMWTGTGIQVQ